MSAIPSSAMPHAYANDDDGQDSGAREASSRTPSKGMLVGGAIAAGLLYLILR
ncbi:hypothetical protein [Tsuneonella deserti]|uniref:hypothetical protein n=1 Tax=Tsuneonella deserti TaxID=2035528 RepID=UPI00166E6198|nr:hypothetical protein [Tsuneonella deserti]